MWGYPELLPVLDKNSSRNILYVAVGHPFILRYGKNPCVFRVKAVLNVSALTLSR
jgi:hypothetical protein